jgi:hypothetical protein
VNLVSEIIVWSILITEIILLIVCITRAWRADKAAKDASPPLAADTATWEDLQRLAHRGATTNDSEEAVRIANQLHALIDEKLSRIPPAPPPPSLPDPRDPDAVDWRLVTHN